MSTQSHLFISYKSQERLYAQAVRDQLQAWGYRTWLDVDNLPARWAWRNEYEWQHKIDAALKSAAGVLAIITPRAVASRYVTAEWDIALVKRLPFIPLLYEPTPLPSRYRNLSIMEFSTTEKASAFEQLHQRLVGVLNQPIPEYSPDEDYLEALYDLVGQQLSQLMIKTFSTYGTRGQVGAEPLRLEAEIAWDSLRGQVVVERQRSSRADLETEGLDDVNDLLKRCLGRLILVGEAGTGKTITLLNLTRDAVVKRVQDPSAPLPIFASINTWVADQYPTLTDWLADTYAAPPDTAQLIQAGKALLLLDGLDELLDEQDDPLPDSPDPRLHFLNQLPVNNQIVLTCRQAEYAEIAAHSPITCLATLQPLNDVQIEEYLRDQPEVRAVIAADSHLRQILRTPLLLSFFAFAYEGMTIDERRQFEAMQSAGNLRDAIFGSYVRRRFAFERSKPKTSLPYSLSAMLRILGQLALESMLARRGENRITGQIAQKAVGENPTAFLEQAKRLHLLINISGNHWQFIHTLVRDYFAFEPLLTALQEPRNPEMHRQVARVLERSGDRQRVLAHLIATMEERQAYTRRNAAAALDRLKWKPSTQVEIVTYQIAKQQWDKLDPSKMQGDAPIARLVTTVLQDTNTDYEGHQWAAKTLAFLGDVGFEGLHDSLYHHDLEVRSLAALQLSQLGTRGQKALRTAVQSPDAAVQASAGARLGKLRQGELVAPLKTNLYDYDSQVRASAARMLGNIGSREAFDLLKAALADSDYSVREAAVAALGQLSRTELVDTFLGKEVVSTLHHERHTLESEFRRLFNKGVGVSPAPQERLLESIVYALVEWHDDRIYKNLVIMLRHKHSSVRTIAAQGLGQLGDPRAVEALIAALDDESIRKEAALALGNLRDARAIQPLQIALGSADEDFREAAANALQRLEDMGIRKSQMVGMQMVAYIRRKVAGLRQPQIARHSKPTTQGESPKTLTETPTAKKLDTPNTLLLAEAKDYEDHHFNRLIESLNDRSPSTRESAAAELGELGNVRALTALVGTLQDKNSYVRSSAALALGKLSDTHAVQPLILALTDTAPHVRSSAAEALGKLRDVRAIQALQAALQDDTDSFVRRMAEDALKSIQQAI